MWLGHRLFFAAVLGATMASASRLVAAAATAVVTGPKGPIECNATDAKKDTSADVVELPYALGGGERRGKLVAGAAVASLRVDIPTEMQPMRVHFAFRNLPIP